MELRGKTALVTGAARRIGGAVALALAGEGMAVAVHYRSSGGEAGALVSKILAEGGRAAAVGGDLEASDEAERAFDAARAALGPVQVLVNNASRFQPAGVVEADSGSLRREVALHLEAPYLLSRALAAHLPEGEEGRIVNLLDWRSAIPDPGYLPYSVAKGALRSLTAALAVALGPRITVNGVAPGAILPPEDAFGRGLADLTADLPARRPGSVEDVVSACIYLLRDADYVTGAVIPVDGGRHLL